MPKKLNMVAVGGTFDELHKGHRALLVKAFETGEHVLIGLSTDAFAEKMGKRHPTASYGHRLKDLKNFLDRNGFLRRAEIVALNDAYGVTLQRDSIEALIVSRETQQMGIKINEKRAEKGLKPLEIVVIDMIPSENHVPISTTRIRLGEIDREGHLLAKKTRSKTV